MSKVAKCILALLILAISPGFGFWNAGHMIVARIAYDQIKEKNPFVLHTIEHSINKLKDFSNEDKYPFVEGAIWPDENKHIGMEAFNQWHYEDEPYITSDFSGTLMQPQSINITWSINQMKKALLNKNNQRMSQDMTHSFAWRYLIHLVGDIHQPLHTSTLYSKDFSNGDLRGHYFKVNFTENPEITELHKLWDSCFNLYPFFNSPLSEEDWNKLGEISKNLTDTYPREFFENRLKLTEAEDWKKESHSFSESISYQGIKPNEAPSEEYIKKGRKLLQQQLTIGGYRLADLIISIDSENIAIEMMQKISS